MRGVDTADPLLSAHGLTCEIIFGSEKLKGDDDRDDEMFVLQLLRHVLA